MNVHAAIARVNELNRRICDLLSVSAVPDASTLEESIALADNVIKRVIASDRDIWYGPGADARRAVLVDFLHAQIEARECHDDSRARQVRELTASIRRLRDARSVQQLVRRACVELRDAFGFDHVLVSFVEEDAYVVEDARGSGCVSVVPRSECPPEQRCVAEQRTIPTWEMDLPPARGYRDILGTVHYLVAPIIAAGRVVALVHVGRADGYPARDADRDMVDAFTSVFSVLLERMLNVERVESQRVAIARAAALAAERADRLAAAAISLEIDREDAAEPAALPADSPLVAALSERERQVFERLVAGASNAEIAEELAITVETVKTHVKRILRKIGAVNRSEAIALYLDEIGKSRSAFQ
ncbi:LuxR C-terminal-related transcriptional regulator [uncultured Mycolicibacterium sp.]|uniref:helix-turn-helix transcriptional regulator n=1 Tax=uncultured Mycolicibacterium sp. TaxID=2320817 RepID=UPI00262F9B7D|nr:LuxR C-terminal-related transcriptional regulator [uncultured Mycolicibacterium sp.]